MIPYSMKFAKKAKIKIKFPKLNDTFLDSIPWLKSHQATDTYKYQEKLGGGRVLKNLIRLSDLDQILDS